MKKKMLYALPVMALALTLGLGACGKTQDPAAGGAVQTESTDNGQNHAGGESQSTGNQESGQAGTDAGNASDAGNTGKPENAAEKFVPATAGPGYVTAVASREYFSEGYMDYEEPAYVSSVEAVYLTTPGYEKLASSLKEYNRMIYEDRVTMDLSTGEYLQGEDAQDEWNYYPWNYDNMTTVVRSDSRVFSMICSTEEYMGGAHPNYYAGGLSFDTITGKKLELADVVTDMEAFQQVLFDELKAFEDDYEALYDDWEEILKQQLESENGFNWYYLPNGICVFFNPYDIAPYATGLVELTLTYEKYPELLKPEYLGSQKEKMGEETITADINSYVTGLYQDVVIPLSARIGSISFDEMLDFVKDLGYEYTKQEPFEESDGEITLYDKDSEDHLILFCWPDEQGAPILYDMWFFHGSCRMAADDFYHESEEILYCMYDDNVYEKYRFDSLEGVTAAVFLREE